ncbi:hypothetical protein EDB81DRAFT_884999 [Dactylonectria macrodidyma]|uniref:Uncharacterized protein n=1 Tax=Dactylonectria macrodidyma TaxID=307937 RepID=A0A9P9ELZ4_9HYPO|nr:hypothetical protein EDB81DRAFT_884999 [Dactylonectria macrodidyma]
MSMLKNSSARNTDFVAFVKETGTSSDANVCDKDEAAGETYGHGCNEGAHVLSNHADNLWPIHYMGAALGAVAVILAYFTNDISPKMNNKLSVDLKEHKVSHLNLIIHHHKHYEDSEAQVQHEEEKVSTRAKC